MSRVSTIPVHGGRRPRGPLDRENPGYQEVRGGRASLSRTWRHPGDPQQARSRGQSASRNRSGPLYAPVHKIFTHGDHLGCLCHDCAPARYSTWRLWPAS